MGAHRQRRWVTSGVVDAKSRLGRYCHGSCLLPPTPAGCQLCRRSTWRAQQGEPWTCPPNTSSAERFDFLPWEPRTVRAAVGGWLRTSSWMGGSHWERVGLESSSSDLESSQWPQAHPPTYHMLVLWSTLHVTCANEWLVPGLKGYFVLQNVKCIISEKETKSDSEKLVLVLFSTMNDQAPENEKLNKNYQPTFKRNPHVDCCSVVLIRWDLTG